MSEITISNGKNATISGGSPAPSAQQWGGWFFVMGAGIVALAAALRMLFIAKYEVWLDEAYCFAVARKSIGAIFTDLASDNGPPLYYIALHYWMKAFGDGPTALRSLSVVFSVATVAVVLAWSTPWFSRRARLLAGFALAITPLGIYYAQEARMYAPVAFFALLSMVFLERALRTDSVGSWGLFAVTTALSLYTGYAAFFVLPTGYMVILVMYAASRDFAALKRRLWAIVTAHIVAASLFAPWLPTFVKQPSAAAVRWIGPMWQNEPHRFLIPVKSLSVMTTGGAYYPPYLRNLGLDPARIAYVRDSVKEGKETRGFVRALAAAGSKAPATVMMMLIVFTLATALRKGGDSFPITGFLVSYVLAGILVAYLNVVVSLSLLAAAAGVGAALAGAFALPLPKIESGFPWRALLLSWALLAFMVPYVASFKTPLFVPGRYDLTACVGYAVLTGIGLARLPRKWLAAILALMVVLFLYTFGYMQSKSMTARFSPKAKALAQVVRKGDVVIGTSYEYGQVYYHIGAMRDDLVWMDFPRENAKHFAWLDFDRWLHPGWEGEQSQPIPKTPLWREAGDTIVEAAGKARPGGAIAIVWPGNPPVWEKAINRTLEIAARSLIERGALVEDERATNVEQGIWVLRRPGPPQ